MWALLLLIFWFFTFFTSHCQTVLFLKSFYHSNRFLSVVFTSLIQRSIRLSKATQDPVQRASPLRLTSKACRSPGLPAAQHKCRKRRNRPAPLTVGPTIEISSLRKKMLLFCNNKRPHSYRKVGHNALNRKIKHASEGIICQKPKNSRAALQQI